MEAQASALTHLKTPPPVGRLLRRAEFLANKANGKSWNAKTLIVSISPSIHPTPRLGLTVTKACGNAVVRNRIRRRLRHLAKELCVELGAVDVVVIGKSPAETAPWDTLKADFLWCLKRLGFTKPEA